MIQQLVIDINGVPTKVSALKVSGELWAHFNGQTHCIALSKGHRKRGAGSVSVDPGQVVSPMPGKILKVNIVEGASVEQGQVLVIMEAMKMEYSLKADISGQVTRVSCAEGDQVNKEQVLVEVKAYD